MMADQQPDIMNMLRGYATQAEVLELAAPTTTLTQDGTILGRVQQRLDQVNLKCPDMKSVFKRLVVSVLLCRRRRMIDTSIHEHVELLHTLTVDSHLRAHGGIAHLHRDGAWTKYQGVPSEGLLEQTRGMLLGLEGLLRHLSEELTEPEVIQGPSTSSVTTQAMRGGGAAVAGWHERQRRRTCFCVSLH